MIKFDLNLLRVLVALDRTRHVGRAAVLSNMSQSGFSTALARMRRQVNDELFVRSTSGMRPTPHAEKLIATARSVIQQVEGDAFGPATFDPVKSEVTFRLFLSDVGEAVFMPTLIRHLSIHAPKTSVLIAAPGQHSLAEQLVSGSIDLVIGFVPDLEKNRFYRQALLTHSYACIVRKGHPVLKSGLGKETYQALGHAVTASPARSTALLESALARQRIRRRVVLSSPNHLALPATISRTDLIATLPLGAAIDCSRSGELVVVPLPFRPPSFTTYQYWHRRTHKEPGYQWLRTQLKALFNPSRDPYAEKRQALCGR